MKTQDRLRGRGRRRERVIDKPFKMIMNDECAKSWSGIWKHIFKQKKLFWMKD